ncbi:hypothetical protein [Parasynechococcus sp.]
MDRNWHCRWGELDLVLESCASGVSGAVAPGQAGPCFLDDILPNDSLD